MKWDKKVKGIIKAEMALRNLSHQDLVDDLAKIGVKTSKASVANKLSRGTFSASFFLQCLNAIGCKEIKVK